jgi:hypothetical protein
MYQKRSFLILHSRRSYQCQSLLPNSFSHPIPLKESLVIGRRLPQHHNLVVAPSRMIKSKNGYSKSLPAITAKAKTSSKTAKLPMANRSTSAMIAPGKAARIQALTPIRHKDVRRSCTLTRSSALASEVLRAPAGFHATPLAAGSNKAARLPSLWSEPYCLRRLRGEPCSSLTSCGPLSEGKSTNAGFGSPWRATLVRWLLLVRRAVGRRGRGCWSVPLFRKLSSTLLTSLEEYRNIGNPLFLSTGR